jgi:Tn3 transposase DDE domain
MPRETDNQHITEEKNPHIKFKKNGGFTLSTPRQEESDAEPLQQFFPGRRFVPLVEVLSTVNRFTHYVDELQHPQQRYHHGKPSEATIYAGIIGIGCAIGLRRMRISHGINEEGIGARGEPSKRIWSPAGVAN